MRKQIMDELTFYAEWLPLPKEEFRIMVMLADKKSFTGNLSDMCRYFSLNPQSSNRTKLRNAIEKLSEQNFLNYSLSGRSYNIDLVPKEKEIHIKASWLHTLMAHNYRSEAVAWEQVLKVLLWTVNNHEELITNAMIAHDLNISVSTIGAAKNVLEYEYGAITRKKRSEKIGEESFMSIGHELFASAWWKEE